MIRTHNVGNLKISSVIEYYGPTHDPSMFPGSNAADLKANADWLVPDYYVPSMDKLVIVMRIWVVRVEDKIILIDAGVGNGKTRTRARANMLNTLTQLWLESVGATRDSVTHVLMTHLHGDHVGWNTVWEDGKWRPTFPNARYLIPRKDYEYFKAAHDVKPDDMLVQGFHDSILPIMEAGLGDFVESGDVVADIFRVSEMPGHTPGMLGYWFESSGQSGVFCGDMFHHPIQIHNPQWNSPPDIDLEMARQSRVAFLKEVAGSGTLIMPCHFSPPGCGFVRQVDGGYIYEPLR